MRAIGGAAADAEGKQSAAGELNCLQKHDHLIDVAGV
jgi:hypothetical protein